MNNINKNAEENSKSYLTFKMSGEKYAANVANVQNILELPKITKVPKTPDYFLGVIDLRGVVLPLIDIRIKLGLQKMEKTINTCILVMETDIENKSIQLGMLVDEVDEVIEIEQNQIQSPPSIGNKLRTEILQGLYKTTDNTNFTMILNLNKIFEMEELDDIRVFSEGETILR